MGRICMDCGQIIHKDSIECQYCNSNNISELNSTATLEDYFVLRKVSKDANFIKAMMELHDTDIIEYELKMSQFKSQLIQTKTDNQVHCPYCRSINLKRITTTAKVVNIAMFGLLGNKRKYQWHCNSCNTDF